jgi:hypothetical protein
VIYFGFWFLVFGFWFLVFGFCFFVFLFFCFFVFLFFLLLTQQPSVVSSHGCTPTIFSLEWLLWNRLSILVDNSGDVWSVHHWDILYHTNNNFIASGYWRRHFVTDDAKCRNFQFFQYSIFSEKEKKKEPAE